MFDLRLVYEEKEEAKERIKKGEKNSAENVMMRIADGEHDR